MCTTAQPEPHVNNRLSTDPDWISLRAGAHEIRIPFIGTDEIEGGWDYVLALTSYGFRADRIGDAIIITGRPGLEPIVVGA